jgi:hypothetical protein
MNNKKSFVFYDSWGEVFDEMDDESAGKMIKIMIEYHRKKEVKNAPLMLRLAFALIKNQMDADAEKYDEICEKRKNAGAKGGDAKAEKKANVANAKFAKQKKQKLASVADNDNDNDNDINTLLTECDNIADTPTLENIKKFCEKENLNIDANKFFNHYTSLGWKTATGVPITDWQAKARVWNAVDKPKKGFAGRTEDYGEEIYADTSNLEV